MIYIKYLQVIKVSKMELKFLIQDLNIFMLNL